MIRYLIAALALGVVACGSVAAEPQVQDKAEAQDKADPSQPTRMGAEKDKHVYVQLIVKACRQAETPLEPTNQGKIYDNEKSSLSGVERRAALTSLGCIDVPVPMEFLADAMSPNACIGHAGFMAAMQFLEQRQDLAEFPAVGAWQCVITDHEVIGATTM